MNLKLRIWRQKGPTDKGHFENINANDVSEDMSFLEMLDMVNVELVHQGKEAIAFDHDCREGICGMCSLVINGNPHGPDRGTTTCQLHMRRFKDGDSITIEPFRARAFPIVKDLVVDRSSFDNVIQAGGFVSVNVGNAQDANCILVGKEEADEAFNSAACIGCGACVAACKNASANLFVGAKITQLSILPQGQIERTHRAMNMVAAMDEAGFGSCTNTGACEATCPKEIKLSNIANLHKEFIKASLCGRK